MAEKQYDAARAGFEKALAIEGIAPARQAQAQMGIGRSLELESAVKTSDANRAYTDAIISYARVADIAGVSHREKYDARMAVASTFMTIKNYGEAVRELKEILQARELAGAGDALARFTLARCLFYERNYAAARDEFARALAIKRPWRCFSSAPATYRYSMCRGLSKRCRIPLRLGRRGL